MRLKAHISSKDNNTSFLVYNDVYPELSDISGIGWDLKDVVDDFLAQFNAWAFYDDDTPSPLSRNDVVIDRIKIIHKEL